MDIPRMSAKALRQSMKGSRAALLVCAYESEDRFHELELQGAVSWKAFQSRLPTLPPDQEIVFYCACPGEESAAHRAAEVLALGFTNVQVLKGGVEAWKKAGFPLTERKPTATLFERILVPLDGSAASEAVLYQAEHLLCGRKSEIILFHAWGEGRDPFPTRDAADRYLLEIGSRLRLLGARSIRPVIDQGPVADSILEASERERVSLVALSSHGSGTSPEVAVAGTVEGVLERSRAPLFLARSFLPSTLGAPEAAACTPSTISRILVPLDGSSASEAVMPYARDMAILLGALIVILYVSPDAPGMAEGSGPGGAPGAERTAVDRIREASRTFSAAGLDTLTLEVGGDPISTLLGFARPSAVDLLALTTHGRTGLPNLLRGPVAEKVFREAVLPTLLIRADATGEVRSSPVQEGGATPL
jgi:nucleotide-binding universal stress UspA family protein/rhodanese-related sulfurtransferase